MPARLHPGVYVEEVPSAARAIEAGGTSTAIFVGEAERGPLEPTRIKGRAEYERLFGGYTRHATAGGVERVSLTYAVDAFFQNGGSTAYILRAIAPAAVTASRTLGSAPQAKIVAASPGAWGNNVSAVFCESSAGPDRFRIAVLYKAPGSATARVVEDWDRLSAAQGDETYVVDVLKRSVYIRWNPGTPAAIPNITLETPADDAALIAEFTNYQLSAGTGGDTDLTAGSFPALLARLDEIDDASLLVIPARVRQTATDAENRELAGAALAYAIARPQQDLFCIADMPRYAGLASATAATDAAIAGFGSSVLPKTHFGAVYFPWIEINDPAGTGRDPVLVVPPSGFVAGLYARTDARRGVWKAPAGLDATVLGVRRLEYKLLDGHQDELNPLGVNALRVHATGGAVVWGSRTMRPDSEWRYIPVRRTAIFLRKSIFNGIQWAVFEPNGEDLWASLRLTITSFMDQLFRQGAFAGKTPREAYFVKCDADTTPEADRIAGVVNVWVGFAPLRPAEFVVVKLSQIVNQNA